ncbi:hypothetical protein [Streptomyces sp. NPDC091278]|uniref:hypothetical protein n=1 Tax=Streptomyces sp. NPDC091278 TaxID=3155301 RepID=UPI00344FF7E8
MPRLADARPVLAEETERRGEWPERAPWTRQAAEALPREEFAPDRVWRWDGHAYSPVDRGADPNGWAAEIYPGSGAATVTQVGRGTATSSLSAEGVVANMLDSLLLEPGHRVLEWGPARAGTRHSPPGRPGPVW